MNLTMVYRDPFVLKAALWAILKDFDFDFVLRS